MFSAFRVSQTLNLANVYLALGLIKISPPPSAHYLPLNEARWTLGSARRYQDPYQGAGNDRQAKNSN